MNRFLPLFLHAVVAGWLAAGRAAGAAAVEGSNGSAPAGPGSDGTSQGGVSSQAVIESWGWVLAEQHDLRGIELSGEELSRFLRGFSNNVTGQPPGCGLRS